MLTTDKYTCRALAAILPAHGVLHCVVSPGSRNAPLIVAFNRQQAFKNKVSVIDERCAGFVALGMALQLQQPVAVVCTSGTALLNLAPAVCEAFYRHVPLIVISADRPSFMIDRCDSQTMRQPGVFRNFVKDSVDLPLDCSNEDERHYADLLINRAAIRATSGVNGPVHINVPIASPLCDEMDDESDSYSIVENYDVTDHGFTPTDAREFVKRLTGKRVMIVAGFTPPDNRLSNALSRLTAHSGFVLVREAQSNIHIVNKNSVVVDNFNALADIERLPRPDVVISIGGSILSSKLKKYLRSLENVECWEVGNGCDLSDCFNHLALNVDVPADLFMHRLASAIEHSACPAKSELASFNEAWGSAHLKCKSDVDCDMILEAVKHLPEKCNLHVSNGSVIRHLQFADYGRISRIECNRGVSGIDGCTSTAIGAMLVSSTPTYLLTGDMSAQYDIGALAMLCESSVASRRLANRQPFKMIVLANGDGAIFHTIDDTRSLCEVDTFISPKVNLPLKELAKAYNLEYFKVEDCKDISSVMQRFVKCRQNAILELITKK